MNVRSDVPMAEVILKSCSDPQGRLAAKTTFGLLFGLLEKWLENIDWIDFSQAPVFARRKGESLDGMNKKPSMAKRSDQTTRQAKKISRTTNPKHPSNFSIRNLYSGSFVARSPLPTGIPKTTAQRVSK